MTTSRSRGRRASSSSVRSLSLVAVALMVAATSGCGSESGSATSSTTAASPTRTWCPSTASLLIRRNSLPSQICLRAGSVLTLTSDGVPEAPWEDIVSSSNVLQCTSRRLPAKGTVSGTCSATAAGTSQVTTATRARGDSTNGPGDNAWILTVTIVG